MRPSVSEALDTDLDAYLDRELFARPTEPEIVLVPEPEPEPMAPAHSRSLQELAAAEEEWLLHPPPPEPAPTEPPSEPPSEPLSVALLPPGSTRLSPRVGSRRMTALVLGVLGGVCAMGALTAGLLWAKRNQADEVGARVSVAAPAPVEATPSSVAAPPTPRAPSEQEAQPAPSATVQEPQAPSPEPSRPVAARAEPPVSAEPPELVPAKATAPRRQARAAANVAAEAVLSSSERLVDEAKPSRGSSSRQAAPASSTEASYEDFDEEYARELGFTEKKAPERTDPRSERSVWIPPAPGEELPERLTSEVIMRVVLGHKAAISACIQQHKARTQSGAGGRLVARWSIETNGSTSGVAVETAEFQGTPLARCMEALIRGWKFPHHRVHQSEPIRFPVTF